MARCGSSINHAHRYVVQRQLPSFRRSRFEDCACSGGGGGGGRGSSSSGSSSSSVVVVVAAGGLDDEVK